MSYAGGVRVLAASLNVIRLAWRFARRMPAQLAWLRFPASARRLLRPFAVSAPAPTPQHFDGLVRYFAEGWRCYRLPDRSGARYPGLPSWSGARADALEGFSRLMPLFGAWCAGGRTSVIPLPGGGDLDLEEEFARGLLAGTHPASPGYWGRMEGTSPQQIVEAADIGLTLWLLRETVWRELSAVERERVVAWLRQMDACPGLDKNWHLFYVLTDRVLDALGYPGCVPSARWRFDRIKAFHLGDGWFADGPAGRVDYYNAWGFHYPLYWIDRIDGGWDPDFILTCSRRFLQTYRFLIGPEGFPVLGRSIPYRIAAAAPLVLWHSRHADIVTPGVARRALDVTWSYFIRRGAVRHGIVTQGYHGPDARLVDSYSGPASSLWSLRSLIAAYAFPPDAALWTSAPEPLPIERAGFEFTIDGPGWHVRGDHGTRAISIEVLANPLGSVPPLEAAGVRQYVQSIADERPVRARNDEAKYGRRFYRSDVPIGG